MEDLAALLDDLRRRLALHAESSGVVLATVVRARGSTPRKTGARMLMDPARGTTGTIGGGCGEAEILTRAQRTLATGEPQLVEVRLLEDEGFESESICGGVLDVFVERLADRFGGVPTEEFFAGLDAVRSSGGAALVSVVRGGDATLGRKTLFDAKRRQTFPLGDAELDRLASEAASEAIETSRAAWADGPSGRVYAEPIAHAPEVVVVGAGHVGTAVCEVASRAGFAVTVLDDREAFANPARLPDARRILVGDPRERLRGLGSRRDRHFVLVTRGHRLDAECLEVTLELEADYVGMIGSKRRVRRIREWLTERGATAADLERLHAPIGLDIGAETPSEIAVAIVAEIIGERRRRRSSRSG